ncbi:hypothetical protein Aperf_G00000120130 [Anoplocephala perfoliata]
MAGSTITNNMERTTGSSSSEFQPTLSTTVSSEPTSTDSSPTTHEIAGGLDNVGSSDTTAIESTVTNNMESTTGMSTSVFQNAKPVTVFFDPFSIVSSSTVSASSGSDNIMGSKITATESTISRRSDTAGNITSPLFMSNIPATAHTHAMPTFSLLITISPISSASSHPTFFLLCFVLLSNLRSFLF